MVTPAYRAAGMTGPTPLQNQRLWLTGAAGVGVDAGRIHQDIITGTVFQRPGLNDLLNAVQAGDVLMVTALETGWDATRWVSWSFA